MCQPVLRIRDVYPGSELFLLGSRIQGEKDSGSASKNLIIFDPKIVSKLSEIWFGMLIPDPGSGFWFLPVPNPKAPDPGSGSATLMSTLQQYVYHSYARWYLLSHVISTGTGTGTHLLVTASERLDENVCTKGYKRLSKWSFSSG